MKVKNKNIMKNLLVVLFSVLSAFSVNAQILDISNDSYRINDSIVLNSDSFEYNLTGIRIYDIHNSDEDDLLAMLANSLDMGFLNVPEDLMDDPKTFFDWLYVDYRIAKHRKKIVKEIKDKLADKVVIFYYINEDNEREDLHRLDI
jgi:hypothetical protein